VARLNYYWRLLATGFGFALFSCGGLFLATCVFPLFFLLPQKNRSIRVRWCIHKSFSGFLGVLQCLGVMRLEVLGREHLLNRSGVLILANHPTLLDVVALIALIPNASCVVKQALWDNFFLGGVVRAAEYLSNAQSDLLIDACVQDIQQGRPLVIFPEGTRTVDMPLRFQRGASYVALRGASLVQPVLIQCDPVTLGKGVPWYRIPCRRFRLRLTVLPALDVMDWVDPEVPSTLQARRLTSALETFFMDKLKADE
jgi:1-acyl-sn-glycerol-3-phosphate acyltransferase